MATKHNASKKQEEKENNYQSRFDKNRQCYRKDETHYIYLEWVETGKNQGFYHEHIFTVGEEGVTLELLDYLQATDNGEVQDQEDDERNKEKLAENTPSYQKSPEEELCSEEEEQSPASKEFDEKVKPHLSEDQMNLIYDYYGMDKTYQEIADDAPLKPDGTHISLQSVFNKMSRINAKVKKYMPQD